MTIPVQTFPVKTHGPKVVVKVADGGGAHVSITLFIPGVTPVPVEFRETFAGSKEFTFLIPTGAHDCDVQIAAFRTGNALGPSYDSTVEINGILAAAAKGALAPGQQSDVGFNTIHFLA